MPHPRNHSPYRIPIFVSHGALCNRAWQIVMKMIFSALYIPHSWGRFLKLGGHPARLGSRQAQTTGRMQPAPLLVGLVAASLALALREQPYATPKGSRSLWNAPLKTVESPERLDLSGGGLGVIPQIPFHPLLLQEKGVRGMRYQNNGTK